MTERGGAGFSLSTVVPAPCGMVLRGLVTIGNADRHLQRYHNYDPSTRTTSFEVYTERTAAGAKAWLELESRPERTQTQESDDVVETPATFDKT